MQGFLFFQLFSYKKLRFFPRYLAKLVKFTLEKHICAKLKFVTFTNFHTNFERI
jgi:hypothetical protein